MSSPTTWSTTATSTPTSTTKAARTPSPYTYPVTVQFDDGTTGIVGEALSYDFEPGKVTIIMQDLDGWMPQLTLADRPMTFRIVATAPINYIIEQ